MERNELELRASAALELKKRQSLKTTVFGLVCPGKGLTHSIKRVSGHWIDTEEKPTVYLAAKMERVLTSSKRFIVIYGGRGSTKSVAAIDIAIADAKDNGGRTYCLREFQSSIKNSVHSLVRSEIKRFGFVGFDALAQSTNYNEESVFEFAGIARNIDSVKSTHGFKRFEVEEAQFISQASLDVLTPSLRNDPKNGLPSKFNAEEHELIVDIGTHPELDAVSIIFIANPGSSADPFSQRFIEPYKKQVERDGYYEDDLHLIVKINYDDNPWFDDSGLESERAWDYENRDRAYYDHKWLGEYNDGVEDSIIKPEWFDAAIDAHKSERLKSILKPVGPIIAAHDPSDTGRDPKAITVRHGPILLAVKEKKTGEIDDGCDWAIGVAKDYNADWFVWDGDGMGAGLKRQVATELDGTKIKYHMFRGSLSGKGQDNAEKIYMPADDDAKSKKTYAETFKNNRSQYYIDLANRYYATYRCIVKGEYVDPDEMISIDSDGVENMSALRAETCRVPRKKNPVGLQQIMSKDDMRKLGIASPNMADTEMMSLFSPAPEIVKAVVNPLPTASRW